MDDGYDNEPEREVRMNSSFCPQNICELIRISGYALFNLGVGGQSGQAVLSEHLNNRCSFVWSWMRGKEVLNV